MSENAHGSQGGDAKAEAEISYPLPDDTEEKWGGEIDAAVPTSGSEMLAMVGLGGSAGSLGPLLEFFRNAPADTGFGFVVVIHLSPEHESSLPQLLQSVTSMKVVAAEHGMKVEANMVYVIPPGKSIKSTDGHLALSELEREGGRRVAVDLFFRTLADTHGPHATAIVLSGLNGDGAVGIKRIKERGGLTIAQDADEAEYPSMPRAAMATGMVDWVLKVAEMPARIVEYQSRKSRISLPPEIDPAPTERQRAESTTGESAVREVLTFLRMRTGRDFTWYKRATIHRRILRRMQVNAVDELGEYVTLLRTNPGEADALLKDLLISVTNFFRDREAFAELERRIPALFAGKTQSDTLRVWVPACATGEEVYSIAILLLEHARKVDFPPAIQVFGCDLDGDAVQMARAGIYPSASAADLSEDRLRRFFIKEHQGYRVRRELREMALFAVHDLLKDAPFSRMDLVSCRNLLIYLTPDAQDRVIEIFHFALQPNGLLFLGSSESVAEGSPLFRVVDKKHRFYISRPNARLGLPVARELASQSPPLENGARSDSGPVLPGPAFSQTLGHSLSAARAAVGREERMPWAEIHYKLIDRWAPPSVIVNADYDIQHSSEGAARFFQMVGGEPTANLLRLVNPALRMEVRALLFRAGQTGEPVQASKIPFERDGVRYAVDIRVTPAGDLAPDYLLVVFDPHLAALEDPAGPPAPPEPAVVHVEIEIEQVKAHLRDTTEQYEASSEEMKASNEELQAMNEELRSASEELETSREELQSINEELTTVNAELKGKVDELAHTNSDLQNLMASTAIATVFLNRALCITRFTPSAVAIFHLIPGDIGRPLSDLRHGLDYGELRQDAEQVLATLVPIEREVHESDGRTFLARLLPYRTVEDRIAGVVLNFVDVTERRAVEVALREAEERSRLLIESAKDYAIFTMDTARSINSWNPGAEAIFGYAKHEIFGQSADILFTPGDREKKEHLREVETATREGRAANERWHIRRDQSLFWGSGSVMPLRDSTGKILGFLKIMRDLTRTKESDEALRAHMDVLTRFNHATEGRELRMIELKQEINDLCVLLGQPPRHNLEFQNGQTESPLS